MAADLDTQAKQATAILQAAWAELERAGIDMAAVSNALINMGAEGLSDLHGPAFAAEQLRSHAAIIELYAAVTVGEG